MPTSTGTITQTVQSITQSSTGFVHDIGQIVQTLPSLVQSVTATSLEQLVAETALVLGGPFEFATEELVSVLVPITTIVGITEQTVSETANVSETITFDVITELSETATVNESFLGSTQTTTFNPSSLRATEEIIPSVTQALTSAVNVSESFEFGIVTSLSEVALVTEVLDPSASVYTNSLSGIANASSSFSLIGLVEALSSAINASEEITHSATAEEALSSVADVSDVQTIFTLATNSIAGIATVNESYEFTGSITNETLVSVARVLETLQANDFGALAWVLNTQSGGIFSYNNFDFQSIAFHNGKLYATSPDGLFLLDADDDNGRDIASVMKGGFLDFGIEEKKRMSDIYVGYTGGALECDVETYDGPEEVYTYEMEQRDADAPRNSRLKPGRGLSSRYWRFTFRNLSGADFQIQDIAVNIARSNRRL